jgi:uncharacterized membrane protein YeiB
MDTLTFEQATVAAPVADIAAPVAEANRIKVVDMLRGVALLGILLMNIPYFSLPDYFSEAFSKPWDAELLGQCGDYGFL